MKIFLVRHGEALTSEIDPNQALSPQGIKETEAVAAFLRKSHLEIEEIVHSSKIRAKQTAEILGKVLAPKLALVQKEGIKPMDPVEPLLNEIRSFSRNIMIVSHLPYLEKLLMALLAGPISINLCGSCVICLEGEGKSWQIEWMVTPCIL